ncbi:MAG TPA: hypothetical protein VG755_36345 [Nannocystaceae bacterium]|nr:hypothetical protein [Nannocystaceae bacterium]
MRRLPVLLLLLAMTACDRGESELQPRCADGPSADERAQNQVVFDALEPVCVGCHVNGARGYFASIEAFEDLIAYEPTMVTPGDPDGSKLIMLLEGDAIGAFAQMPPGGPSYAELASDGTATLGMTEIRAWVTELGDHPANPLPLASAPRISRLGARDVHAALYQQLGLDDDDFYVPASNYDIPHKSPQGDDLYPISSPDAIPPSFDRLPEDRWASLGGGSALVQMKADPTISPTFAGSLAQVAQRWCALAIDKPGNTALFAGDATSLPSSSDVAGTKALIGRWFLHFHAVEAAAGDVDTVFYELFVPIASEADSRTAWIGTCSWFIRHPDWVFR